MPAKPVEYVPLPYVREPYRDSGYGYRLADLMRQRGDQQAATHLASGDRQAAMWMRAGDIISQSVANWQRDVERNRQMELEARTRAQQEEANRITLESAQMDLDEKKRRKKGESFTRSMLPLARRPEGITTYDRDLLAREYEAAGMSDLLPEVFKSLDEMDAAHLEVLEKRRDAVAADAFRLLQSGASEESFDALLEYWAANDALPSRELDVMKKLGKNPEQRQQALMAAVQSSPRFAKQLQEMTQPKLHNVPEGSTVIDERTGEIVYQGQPKTPTNIEQAILQEQDPAKRQELIALKEQFTRAGRAPDVDRRMPVPVIGPDGKPVYVRPDDAVGKQPANVREQMAGAELPSEYRNALDRAILNLPATRRGPIVQLANRLAAEGNTEGLADVIRQAAVDSENVDTKNQILGRQATLASLRDTRAILEEMQAKGVPTGFFTGTVEDLVRRLGKSTNPEYVALSNRLMGTLINYRRAATGVAFSARESKDYERMFPNYRNDLPVNLALIDGLEREMRTYDAEYWTHKLGKDGAALVGVISTEKKGGATDQSGSGWTDVGGFKVRVKP